MTLGAILDILREVGTLWFLIVAVESYPASPRKGKLKRWLGAWGVIWSTTLLVETLVRP